MKRLPTWVTPQNATFFICLVLATALPWSKALLSIGTGVISAIALWQLIIDKFRISFRQLVPAIVVCSLFLLQVISFFYTENMGKWGSDVRIKANMVGLAFAIAILPKMKPWQYRTVLLSFIAMVTLIASTSLVYYFIDFAEQTEWVRKNSSIDIIGSIHHIYFGLMLAFAVIAGFLLWRKKNEVLFPYERPLLLGITLLNLVFLHILTSRTGLVAFYAAVGGGVFFYILSERQFLKATGLVVVLTALPIVAYHTIPSFYYRVNVTHWDAHQYQNTNNSLNELSLSLRILAWQGAWDIFTKHPVIGVGISDVEDEMRVYYAGKEMRASADQLLENPHSQYLEYLAGFGIVGICVLLCVLVFPLIDLGKNTTLLLFSFICLIFSGMVAESFLERQIGISFFVIFLMLLWKHENRSLS
ncbi:MAG: O-antigen ligase family protein [Bacteroidota bacterium]